MPKWFVVYCDDYYTVAVFDKEIEAREFYDALNADEKYIAQEEKQ